MPRPLLMLLIVVMAGYAVAVAFFPLLRLKRKVRAVAVAVVIAMLTVAPLLIPAEHPVLRFVAGLHSCVWLVKLADLHVGGTELAPRSFAAYLGFLLSPVFVYRRISGEPRSSTRANLRRLGTETIKLILGGAILYAAFHIDWSRTPFLLEHCAKVLAFFLMLIPLSAMASSLFRLAGAPVREPMSAPLSAPTPAAFWLRYNRGTQQWFYEDVFLPFGGMRRPLRGMIIVFVLSAIVHEVLFSVVLGRVQGYQTAFFLLQGCAVIATMRVRPRGRRAIPWIAATLAFNLVSSVLFFASVNQMLPFYSR